METLSNGKLWSFMAGKPAIDKVSGGVPRKVPKKGEGENGHWVSSYRELARKVAELQFYNPEFVLLFRGQARDYPTTHWQSSLKPSIFRSTKKRTSDEISKAPPTANQLHNRYRTLEKAEKGLLKIWQQNGLKNLRRLQRHRVLRWAILQHYEICGTPLLDVTHSLRIAASFATKDSIEKKRQDAFLMVLGIPQLSGAVTVTAEAELQALRLSSICPPEAVRPHLQEGYLLGEYPDLADPDQKSRVPHYEADFGRRLIAKFRFHPREFWKNDSAFPQIKSEALLPQTDDPVEDALAPLRNQFKNTP